MLNRDGKNTITYRKGCVLASKTSQFIAFTQLFQPIQSIDLLLKGRRIECTPGVYESFGAYFQTTCTSILGNITYRLHPWLEYERERLQIGMRSTIH